jgi:hypothetical protein
MSTLPEPARSVSETMNEKIRPIIAQAVDECRAANMTQDESVDAILCGLFYQAGFYVASFEKEHGLKIHARALVRAVEFAVRHGREMVEASAHA